MPLKAIKLNCSFRMGQKRKIRKRITTKNSKHKSPSLAIQLKSRTLTLLSASLAKMPTLSINAKAIRYVITFK